MGIQDPVAMLDTCNTFGALLLSDWNTGCLYSRPGHLLPSS